MSRKTRWVRVVGDGLVYQGPCLITHILFYPHAGTQETLIYDGRDTTSGKLFLRIHVQSYLNYSINLGEGVGFDQGIYIDAEHPEDEVTIVFAPE